MIKCYSNLRKNNMKYKKLKQKSLNTLKSHYFLITITCLLSAFIGIEFIDSMAFLNKHSITINPGTKGVLANLINMYTSKTLFNFAFRTIYSITSSHKITNIIFNTKEIYIIVLYEFIIFFNFSFIICFFFFLFIFHLILNLL